MKTRMWSFVGVPVAILMLSATVLVMLAAMPAVGQERHDPVSGIDFVWVAEGCFQMGSPDSEAERDSNEGPVHEVCLDGFWMGKYEVTQAQWEKVIGNNPSRFKGDTNPVEQVSWDDIQKFLQTLNTKAGKETYRLPTEAEWEYAAQAGTKTTYSFGDDGGKLGDYAWYVSNSGGTTHPVGQLKPNALGLYDMHGNVWEWCQDWYDSGYYSKSPKENPQGPSSGDRRVSRAGSWYNDPNYCRSAHRTRGSPDFRAYAIGFRVVVGSVARTQYPSPNHLKASEALIDTLDLNRSMMNTILLSSPQQAHSIVKYVLGKETGLWDATRKDVSIIYAEMFSEHELKQLTAFFKSDVGKKWIDSQEEFFRNEPYFFKSGVGKKWIDSQEEFLRNESYRRQIAVLGCVTAILVPNIEGAKKRAGITKEGIPPEIRSHPDVELLIQDVRKTCVCVIDEAALKWGFENFVSKQNSPEFGALMNHLLTTGKCPIPGTGMVEKVTIKPGMVGIVFQKSGKVDPDGHFIVEKGYQGIHREVLMPGTHQTTSFMEITQAPMTVIPESKVGILIAQDGRDLPEGAVLAEDDEIDPETGKLIKMGQRGIRRRLLSPGTYPLNTEYFNVEVHDALNIEFGKFGVLIRRIGFPSPNGQIFVSRDSPYRGIIKELVEPGTHYLHPKMYQWEIHDPLKIEPGKVGLLIRKIGDPLAGSGGIWV